MRFGMEGANSGEVLVAGGGAAISECASGLNYCPGWVNVDGRGLGYYESAHPTIANGTCYMRFRPKRLG